MKTYSRRTCGKKRVVDEVFPDLIQHPLKLGLSPKSTGNTDLLSSSGTQKSKGINAKSKQEYLKQLNMTKNGKISKNEELKKSRQRVMENTEKSLTITNEDPLFGDSLTFPVKVLKKHPVRKRRKSNRQVSKESEAEVSVANVSYSKTMPPKDQMKSKDKVQDWLAITPQSESSKEIFRDVHETNSEKKHHMFPDDLFRNLHVRPTKARNSQAVEAKRDKFLENFGLLHQELTESDHVTRLHVSDTQSDLHTVSACTQTMDTDSLKCINETVKVSVPQKYMSSTIRRSLSTNNIEMFPSDLSAIPVSLSNKKQDETTPQRYMDDFKVPGSPTKSSTQRIQRKGALQPKNSTQLFTSGVAEINDFIPQMSTIVMDQDSRKSTQLPKAAFSKMGEDDKSLQKPLIKTSTPNKTHLQEPQFQFDTDISSVTIGSDNEDEIVFNQSSREVCSADILHLSTTRIEEKDSQCSTARLSKSSRLDDTNQTMIHETPVEQVFISKQRKTLKKPSTARKLSSNRKLVRLSTWDLLCKTERKISLRSAEDKCRGTKTRKGRVEMSSVPTLYNIEQSAVNARHPMSLKTAREKNLSFKKCHAGSKNVTHNRFNDMFGNPKRTLSFNSTPSKYLSSRFEFTSGQKSEPRNKKTYDDKELPNDSVFESAVVEEQRKRNMGIPVCPLMNEFTCPRRNVSMIMFKTPDTRSYEDIIRTVPIDDLI